MSEAATNNMVFIALQNNEEARPIIDAIIRDNPDAQVYRESVMVKIDAPGRLVVNRETVEEELGREWDPQELHLSIISLSGNIDEDEDHFILYRD